MINLMVDLETLDNKAGAVITQVALVQFDRQTGLIPGKEFYRNVNAVSCQKAGMTISADTVMWWFKQSKEAQESLLKDPSPIPVQNMLNELNCWLISLRTDFQDKFSIWCHATFDFPILNRAFELCEIVPAWGYRDARDIRTVTDLSGVDPWAYKMPEGQAHNALNDAKNQVIYTVDCLNVLASRKEKV